MSGRKLDPIWYHFEKLASKTATGCRAKCKMCGYELQGLVKRMKAHYDKCNSDVVLDEEHTQDSTADSGQSSEAGTSTASVDSGNGSSAATASSRASAKRPAPNYKKIVLDNFVVKTSPSKKEMLDEQVARMIYATNSPFRMVENPEFVTLTGMMRPGYKPPSRQDIADKYLPQVYQKEMEKCADKLMGQTVSLGLDGWSNVHNEPIVCCTVTTDTGEVYLVDTVDTSGQSHTAEYLTEIAKASIEKAEKDFKCKIGSVVTDNASNVNAMRRNLNDSTNMVTYGCSAHLLNLLAHDLEISNVKEQVKHVVKYFRNNHFASAKLKNEGGKNLVMPQDVRWNTMYDCLDSYLSNWPSILKVCEENRVKIDSVVYNKVTNLLLKRQAEDLKARLEPIATALDAVQSDSAMIANCVDIWKELEEKLQELRNREVMNKFRPRYAQAITPAHLLANLVHPTLQGKKLTPEEKEEAVDYASEKWPSMMPTIIKFQGQASPFQPCKFADEVTKAVSPIAWWQSHDGMIPDDNLATVKQLLSAVAASSGVERVFSSYGLVQSKLRNRLGTDKAAKLVFLFKAMNMK